MFTWKIDLYFLLWLSSERRRLISSCVIGRTFFFFEVKLFWLVRHYKQETTNFAWSLQGFCKNFQNEHNWRGNFNFYKIPFILISYKTCFQQLRKDVAELTKFELSSERKTVKETLQIAKHKIELEIVNLELKQKQKSQKVEPTAAATSEPKR